MLQSNTHNSRQKIKNQYGLAVTNFPSSINRHRRQIKINLKTIFGLVLPHHLHISPHLHICLAAFATNLLINIISYSKTLITYIPCIFVLVPSRSGYKVYLSQTIQNICGQQINCRLFESCRLRIF